MAEPDPGSAMKALFKTPDKGGKMGSATSTSSSKNSTPDKKIQENKSQEKQKSPVKTGGGSPKNMWSAPPKVGVDVEGLIQRAKAIFSDVKEKGLMFNLEQLKQDTQKRTVSVFLTDKKTKRSVRSGKDLVKKALTSLGVKFQRIVAGDYFPLWDVLLPTEEDAVALTKKNHETKDYFVRVEYLGRRRTTVAVQEVPYYLLEDNIAAFLMEFGEIVNAELDSVHGVWSFELMLTTKAFYEVPNWLVFEGRRLPIIVTGRKPVCWRCGETGHLAAKCPGKKAPVSAPSKNQSSLSPSLTKETMVAPVAPPAVVPATSETPSVKPTEESKGGWVMVGKGGRKGQPDAPQSPLDSQVDTDRTGETPQSYAAQTKVRCPSPGKEKFDKLVKWKEELDQARHKLEGNATKQGPLSTPYSPPKPQRVIKPPSPSPSKSQMPPPKLTVLGHKGAQSSPQTTSSRSTPISSRDPSPKPTPRKESAKPTPVKSSPKPSPSRDKLSAGKRQRSPSVGSSEDELPSFKKKAPYGGGKNICKVDANILKKETDLPKKHLKRLEDLRNIIFVKSRDVENPQNFPDARVMSFIRTGKRAEPIMEMLQEAVEVFGPIAYLMTDTKMDVEPGRVPITLHPSLYRALKLTFPRDIGGISCDGGVTQTLGFAPLSHSVGVLTPDQFNPRPQHQ